MREPWIRERLDLAAIIETGEERPRTDMTDDRERATMLVGYLGAFDQALELAWASPHLSQNQLRILFLESGLARCELQRVPLPFPSPMRRGIPVGYLTAPAYK